MALWRNLVGTMSCDKSNGEGPNVNAFDQITKAARRALGGFQQANAYGSGTSSNFMSRPAGIALQDELIRLTGDGSSEGAEPRAVEAWNSFRGWEHGV
jgi:hypothetical protein